MKKFLILFCAFATFTSTFVKAEDLPKIIAPTYTQENYSLSLTQEEIDNLKKWSTDIDSDLKNALMSSSDLNGEAKLDYLKNEIESIIKNHRDQANIFVRYSLTRSLKLIEIIEKEDESSENSILDVKIRLLTQSLKIAKEYTDFDFAKFKKFGYTTYSRFGLDYFALITELAKSVYDASAQYEMYKISLEYLQWDLYREADNAQYASTVVKINNFLNKQTQTISNDKAFVEKIRNIKKLITEIDIRHYQGAVEYNEIAGIVKEAVEKNKNINMSLPFQVGDKAILWNYFKDESINGNIVTITKVRDLSFHNNQLFVYSSYDSKTRKKQKSLVDGYFYKMKGCLKGSELCVGAPVLTYNEPITIIGIGIFNSILGQGKDGEIRQIHENEIFRRAGCVKSMRVCVGDKIRDPEDSNKLKYVTGVRDDQEGSILVGDSIYDEEFRFIEAAKKNKF